MLRPLPDLDDAAAMAKLGRLSALRSARLDALHELRDVVTRIQAGHTDGIEEVQSARAALNRLEELAGISGYKAEKVAESKLLTCGFAPPDASELVAQSKV